MSPANDFDALFPSLFGRQTPEQLSCGHLLSSQMQDGKHFCPSCGLVSDEPLLRRVS